MSADEAANFLGYLQQAMQQGGGGNPICDPSNSDTVANGIIRINAVCRPSEAMRAARFSVDGTFTANSWDTQMTWIMEPTPASGLGARTIRIGGTMTGRRIGDCPESAGAGNSQ